MFKKLKWSISPPERSQLQKILIPNTDGKLNNISESDKIFDAILENNENILREGSDTFTATKEMKMYIGKYGERAGSKKILNGNENPSWLTKINTKKICSTH